MHFTHPAKLGKTTVPYHGSKDLSKALIRKHFQAGRSPMTKNYMVVYVKGKGDDAGYMGYSPDVPRCLSTGDTLEEMRTMMKEALEFHLEGLIEDNEPIPEPHETKVSFDPEVRDEVERYIVEWLPVTVPLHTPASLDRQTSLTA